jgi:hypothetical protein
MLHSGPGDPEGGWSKSLDDLLLTVDRLSLNEDGPEKDAEAQSVGKLGPTIVGRNIFFEELVEAESIEEVVDEGKGTEPFESDGEALFVRHTVGRGCRKGYFNSIVFCIVVITDDPHPTYDVNSQTWQ